MGKAVGCVVTHPLSKCDGIRKDNSLAKCARYGFAEAFQDFFDFFDIFEDLVSLDLSDFFEFSEL